MTEILTAVIPVVIIGVICAAVLVVASKIMAVKEDERFPKVRECLPGANCGPAAMPAATATQRRSARTAACRQTSVFPARRRCKTAQRGFGCGV